MFTLNKLVTAITTFATNHEQVKSFYFNNKQEYGSSESVRYLGINCFIDKGNTQSNSRFLNLNVEVSDKVREDQGNQTEVLSDTELVLLDLFTYLRQLNFGYFINIDENQDYDFFIGRDADNAAGCEASIKIKTIFERDLCSVPVSSLPDPGPYFGKAIVKDVDGNIIIVLNPGEIYIQQNGMVNIITTPYANATGTTFAATDATKIIGVFKNTGRLNLTEDYTLSGNNVVLNEAADNDYITIVEVS
jgi:hypothetical protein